MHSLITGGAGFIGSNLAAQLIRSGHQVTVLDDLQCGYRQNLDPCPVHFIEGAARDPAAVEKAVPGC